MLLGESNCQEFVSKRLEVLDVLRALNCYIYGMQKRFLLVIREHF